MRWLILVVVTAVTAVTAASACGGGTKPAMEPDDPTAKAQADAVLDSGAE